MSRDLAVEALTNEMVRPSIGDVFTGVDEYWRASGSIKDTDTRQSTGQSVLLTAPDGSNIHLQRHRPDNSILGGKDTVIITPPSDIPGQISEAVMLQRNSYLGERDSNYSVGSGNVVLTRETGPQWVVKPEMTGIRYPDDGIPSTAPELILNIQTTIAVAAEERWAKLGAISRLCKQLGINLDQMPEDDTERKLNTEAVRLTEDFTSGTLGPRGAQNLGKVIDAIRSAHYQKKEAVKTIVSAPIAGAVLGLLVGGAFGVIDKSGNHPSLVTMSLLGAAGYTFASNFFEEGGKGLRQAKRVLKEKGRQFNNAKNSAIYEPNK